MRIAWNSQASAGKTARRRKRCAADSRSSARNSSRGLGGRWSSEARSKGAASNRHCVQLVLHQKLVFGYIKRTLGGPRTLVLRDPHARSHLSSLSANQS